MGIQNFGPDHDLGIRLNKIEEDIRALSTRDVLQNASIGLNGLTVNGTGGINVTGGGSITITGTGLLNVASGGLSSAGSISAATTITAGGLITGSGVSAGSGALTGASLNVGGGPITAGNIAASGSAAIAGSTTSTGVVISPGSRAFNMVSGYAGAWINGDGTLGISTSSVEVKQDFAPADSAPKIDALLRLALVDFRRINAVDALGAAAPVELGAIVEYVVGTALVGATFVDPTGKPQGINWSEMIPVMIATIQTLNARLIKLEPPTV